MLVSLKQYSDSFTFNQSSFFSNFYLVQLRKMLSLMHCDNLFPVLAVVFPFPAIPFLVLIGSRKISRLVLISRIFAERAKRIEITLIRRVRNVVEKIIARISSHCIRLVQGGLGNLPKSWC